MESQNHPPRNMAHFQANRDPTRTPYALKIEGGGPTGNLWRSAGWRQAEMDGETRREQREGIGGRDILGRQEGEGRYEKRKDRCSARPQAHGPTARREIGAGNNGGETASAVNKKTQARSSDRKIGKWEI